jgi:glutamyl-tRNA synthetase
MRKDTDWDSDIKDVVRKYALQNALEYNGNGKPSSVLGRIMSERKDLRSLAKKLSSLIESEVSIANEIASNDGLETVKKILIKLNPDALVRKKQIRRTGLPDLLNTENKKIILRFAPNPNGPLTLGHSRGIVINSQFAKKYNGKVVLRFDDTDTKVKPPMLEAYNWIEEEYEWISGSPADIIIRASERMPIYLDYAEKMISKGFGYVCRCSSGEFKKLRDAGEVSPYRNRSIEENLNDWSDMLDGKMKAGEGVVRVKTSTDLPNPALRDWPALRIQHGEHPIVGKKYKVWPLLDFQSAIEDHEQRVTHIIRGKDLMDSTRKQKLLYEHFGWDYPETMYWGRVKVFEFGGFSTSGMRKSIMESEYSGWDDLRLPTIKSLRRRGFDPSSLRSFWLDLGLTQKDISISMQTIESFNIKKIDPITPRRFFVRNPIKLKMAWKDKNIKFNNILKIPNHPNSTNLDDVRKWRFNEFEETLFIENNDYIKEDKFRLKDFADVSKIDKYCEVESIERQDNRQIVHWLLESISREAVLHIPEGNNTIIHEGVIENYNLEEGKIYQFERVGFAKIENIIPGKPIKLIWLHS